MQRYATQVDYANWLTPMDWTHWATCTTGYEMTLKSARRAMERYHKFLKLAGPATMFWAAEPYDCKDGYHTHALIKVPEMYQFKNLVDLWQTASGGANLKKWQRIDMQKYDPKRGAGFYLAKYVNKNISDFDFLI
jgi:hypothetical protein